MLKGEMMIEVTSSFVRVHWEVGWGVVEMMLKLNSPRGWLGLVSIS